MYSHYFLFVFSPFCLFIKSSMASWLSLISRFHFLHQTFPHLQNNKIVFLFYVVSFANVNLLGSFSPKNESISPFSFRRVWIWRLLKRGEFFRSYHLPVLSAEQNDSQPEEINVIDESQAENRYVPVQQAEIRWKKFLWSAILFVVLSGRSKDSSRSLFTVPVSVPVRWVAVSTLLAG